MLLVLCACSDPRLNVYLITLDTTRADHLGCYGYSEIETPHIDRLAAQGTRYDNAWTPVPVTLPAHTSILTGTYPIFHGVRENGGFYVPPEAITLAEILSAEGYDTAAFVGAYPLDSQTGIDQGFDLYDDNYPSSLAQGKHPLLRRFFDERPAAEVSRAALAWLAERGDRPFFLWTHYFDPHQPLQPPPPYSQRYATAPYDGEIASMDEALGQVLEWLETGGLLDETLVVLTADHGEGLGEHGEATHALLLYSSTLRVPLIVRDPDRPGGTTVSAGVTTVDILPSVLQRLGLPVPAESQGVLLPRTDAEASPRREILSETLFGHLIYNWSPLERLTVGSRVLIHGPSQALFERGSDPGEEDDLSSSHSAELAELKRRLKKRKAALAPSDPRRGGVSRAQVSAEARARLEALGYLGSGSGGGGSPSDDVDPTRPDPMTMMEVFNLHNEASGWNDAGRFELAVPVLERARRLDPDNPAVLLALAQAHFGMGAAELGQRELEKLLKVQSQHVGGLVLLARHHQMRGELATASAVMERAVALDPGDLSTRLLWAYLVEDAGRPGAAEEAYRGVLERSPGHTLAANGLATLVYRRGDAAEAVALLDTVLKEQPFYAPAWLNLAVIEYDRGNHGRSRQLAQRALTLRPGYAQAQELLEMTQAPPTR